MFPSKYPSVSHSLLMCVPAYFLWAGLGLPDADVGPGAGLVDSARSVTGFSGGLP